VTVPLPTPLLESGGKKSPYWEIYDLEGHQLTSQLSEEAVLPFLATDIPSVGYRVFWLCPQQDAPETEKSQDNMSRSLLEPNSDSENIFPRKDFV
ncbi:MAG: hypothetical protein ACYT04_97055, partial [Nostoc sp.]